MKTLTIKPKSLAITCLFIILYIITHAQEYNPSPPPSGYGSPQKQYNQPDAGNLLPSGYISINFGFAMPEGNYANAVGSSYGGYALPGDVFHFSLGVPINHSNFGVAFMFGSYSNQYDLNTYANNNADYAIYPDNDYYSENSIMGGLYVTFPLGILSFDGRLMIGGLLNSFPEQDYGYNDVEGDNYQLDLQSSNSTSLAFDAGIGVRCLIGHFWRRKLCAMLNVDYLYSNASYNTEQNIYEVPVTGPNAGYQVQIESSPVFSGSIPISLLNITLGLGYQF